MKLIEFINPKFRTIIELLCELKQKEPEQDQAEKLRSWTKNTYAILVNLISANSKNRLALGETLKISSKSLICVKESLVIYTRESLWNGTDKWGCKMNSGESAMNLWETLSSKSMMKAITEPWQHQLRQEWHKRDAVQRRVNTPIWKTNLKMRWNNTAHFVRINFKKKLVN